MPVTSQQAHRWAHRYGGLNRAARALGVAEPTFRHWLDRSVKNAAYRERYAANGERKREYERERYWSKTGVQYNHRLLQIRRAKALKRIANRQRQEV